MRISVEYRERCLQALDETADEFAAGRHLQAKCKLCKLVNDTPALNASETCAGCPIRLATGEGCLKSFQMSTKEILLGLSLVRTITKEM